MRLHDCSFRVARNILEYSWQLAYLLLYRESGSSRSIAAIVVVIFVTHHHLFDIQGKSTPPPLHFVIRVRSDRYDGK